MTTTPHTSIVAIDPLKRVLPDDVYQILIEKFHPHTPSFAELGQFVKSLPADEKSTTVAMARQLENLARVVIEAAR